MKHSILWVSLFSCILFSSLVHAVDPGTATIGIKVICAIVIYASDKGYHYYSKRCIKPILNDFKQYNVQTRNELVTKSDNATYYAHNLGPACTKTVGNYIQMNNQSIPENYRELIAFMANNNFDFMKEIAIRTLKQYPQSEALGCWYAYRQMLRAQEKLVDSEIKKS